MTTLCDRRWRDGQYGSTELEGLDRWEVQAADVVEVSVGPVVLSVQQKVRAFVTFLWQRMYSKPLIGSWCGPLVTKGTFTTIQYVSDCMFACSRATSEPTSCLWAQHAGMARGLCWPTSVRLTLAFGKCRYMLTTIS